MSKCEQIELQDLSLNDPIELAAPAAHMAPANPARPGSFGSLGVVRLVGDQVPIEASGRLTGNPQRGHHFQTYGHPHLTWCDLCGEFIWGLYKTGLRCSYCRYTCHPRCRPHVQLDCRTDTGVGMEVEDFWMDCVETDTNVDEHGDRGKQTWSVAEIQQKVKEFNAQTNSNLHMVPDKDGSYTGFIKVHFQLLRPVSLPHMREGCMGHRTSFYLPRDSSKHLHVSSCTRVREVIEALLNKFTVVDNPAKFALFERSERHVLTRKLSDDECPLHLRLCAGPSEKVLSLVLKENQMGEVMWEAFTSPELQNFLRILQREEEEHVRQIVRRYAAARDRMKEAMDQTSAAAGPGLNRIHRGSPPSPTVKDM